MSLRATFLLLLFANLAFFGWAALVDVPAEPPPSDSIGNLPQLKLLSEVRSEASSAGPAAAAGTSASGSGVPTPAGNSASKKRASAADDSGGSTASGASPTSPAPPPTGAIAPRPLSAGTAAAGAEPAVATGAANQRCITIGPFTDPERAREAADVLRTRGFAPHARTAANRTPAGYWVFIGGLKSSADEAKVLHRLERNGISDAKVMPPSDAGRRVSVGLFNALDGAQRRAHAVQRLGLEPQVEPRPAEPAHWVDVDLDSSRQSLPAEGLLSLEEPGSRLEIKECPVPEQGAGPAPRPLTAARHTRSG